MGKNTSYKSMLRDRCPLVVNLALKWCKAKECWINHVYDNYIKILVDKNQRYEATRIALGLSKNCRSFDFKKTIGWDNMDDEEKENWETVVSWVEWFQGTYLYIESTYKNCLVGLPKEEQQRYIVSMHLKDYDSDIANKLAEYLINTLENN